MKRAEDEIVNRLECHLYKGLVYWGWYRIDLARCLNLIYGLDGPTHPDLSLSFYQDPKRSSYWFQEQTVILVCTQDEPKAQNHPSWVQYEL